MNRKLTLGRVGLQYNAQNTGREALHAQWPDSSILSSNLQILQKGCQYHLFSPHPLKRGGALWKRQPISKIGTLKNMKYSFSCFKGQVALVDGRHESGRRKGG